MSIQIDVYLCGCSLMVEPQPSKLTTGVRFSSSAPEKNLLELLSIMINIKFRNGFDFFVFKKVSVIFQMVNVIKKEIKIDNTLKKKLEFICSFCNTTPTFYNGSIRTIEHTNLMYVEPHRVVIKGITFLVFNYEPYIYEENLSKCIPLNKFEDYLKNI